MGVTPHRYMHAHAPLQRQEARAATCACACPPSIPSQRCFAHVPHCHPFPSRARACTIQSGHVTCHLHAYAIAHGTANMSMQSKHAAGVPPPPRPRAPGSHLHVPP